jgi:Rod binding domain-containing protein
MTLDAVAAPIKLTHGKESLTGEFVNQADSGNKDLSQTRLKGAVKDLEALFFYEMLKEMKQTTHGDFLGKGMGSDTYSSLFDMEMAKLFAERGLGLGEIILKQIKGRGNNKPEGPASLSQDPIKSSWRKDSLPISSTGHQGEDSG